MFVASASVDGNSVEPPQPTRSTVETVGLHLRIGASRTSSCSAIVAALPAFDADHLAVVVGIGVPLPHLGQFAGPGPTTLVFRRGHSETIPPHFPRRDPPNTGATPWTCNRDRADAIRAKRRDRSSPLAWSRWRWRKFPQRRRPSSITAVAVVAMFVAVNVLVVWILGARGWSGRLVSSTVGALGIDVFVTVFVKLETTPLGPTVG